MEREKTVSEKGRVREWCARSMDWSKVEARSEDWIQTQSGLSGAIFLPAFAQTEAACNVLRMNQLSVFVHSIFKCKLGCRS